MSDEDKSLASGHHRSELFILAQHEPPSDLFKQPPALYPPVLDKTNPSAHNPPELFTEAICQQATCGLEVCPEMEPACPVNYQSGHPETELSVSDGQRELADSPDQLLRDDGQGQSVISDPPVTPVAWSPLKGSSISIHKDCNCNTALTKSLEKKRLHHDDHLITAFVIKKKLSAEEMLPLFQKTCVILNRTMPATRRIAGCSKAKTVWSRRRNHAKTELLFDGTCLGGTSSNPTSSFMASSTAINGRLKQSHQHISLQMVDSAVKCRPLLDGSPLERIRKAKFWSASYGNSKDAVKEMELQYARPSERGLFSAMKSFYNLQKDTHY